MLLAFPALLGPSEIFVHSKKPSKGDYILAQPPIHLPKVELDHEAPT